MNLSISLEFCFSQTPDGLIWTDSQFGYSFWKRYLEVFDRVGVIARIAQVKASLPEWHRADGDQVSFTGIPFYKGPLQYLLRFPKIHHAIQKAVGPTDAVIMRVGSQIAASLSHRLYRTGHPFGVEVVGDPYEVFAPGVVAHPLRPLFRLWFTRQLQEQCRRATTASYVTETQLQKRYPAGNTAFSTFYSDIELPKERFICELAKIERLSRLQTLHWRRLRLIFVGSLEQLYKGPDVLIDAMEHCLRVGLNLELVLVGDGKFRAQLEKQVSDKGLHSRIFFRGQLSGFDAVARELDQADVFILPSRTEGLPRALIEAMARGLPCIGTNVGGIPELLPDQDLVPPDDAYRLAGKIQEFVRSIERMKQSLIQNLHKAKEYQDDVLRRKRIECYGILRERTETWICSKHSVTRSCI